MKIQSINIRSTVALLFKSPLVICFLLWLAFIAILEIHSVLVVFPKNWQAHFFRQSWVLPWLFLGPILYQLRDLYIGKRKSWVSMIALWVGFFLLVWILVGMMSGAICYGLDVTLGREVRWESFEKWILHIKSAKLFLTSLILLTAQTAIIAWLESRRRNSEYQQELGELKDQRIQLEKALLEKQLSVLKGQLNPHFLFNTLNTVSYCMIQENRDEAVKIIAELSDLLRYCMKKRESSYSPLREEIKFCRKYLRIMQARYQGQLNSSVVVGEDCLDCLVPTLLLQPLLENTIIHGVDKMTTPVNVAIQIEKHEDQLQVKILNDCPVKETHGEDTHGQGIQITIDMLRASYGDAISYKMGSVSEGRYEVTLELPFKKITKQQ